MEVGIWALFIPCSGNIEICLYVAVEVNYPWDLSTLASFAPSLGQLRNLYKFLFSQIRVSDSISLGENEQLVATFMSWFCILDFLQQLHMNSACFLQGYSDQVLMCLKISLEALWLTHCQLSESVLNCVSQHLCNQSARELSLSWVRLTHLYPKSPWVLLKKVTVTERPCTRRTVASGTQWARTESLLPVHQAQFLWKHFHGCLAVPHCQREPVN